MAEIADFVEIEDVAYKVLPDGKHPASVLNVRKRFVVAHPDSRTRKDRFDVWLNVRQAVRGIIRVQAEHVDGSFVTDWEHPKDIDVSFTFAAIDYNALSQEDRDALDWIQARALQSGCDVVYVIRSPDSDENHAEHEEFRVTVEEYFARCRDKDWNPMIDGPEKGYIEVQQ